MSTDIPLLLFAKAPIAGKVKTRLQTHCTPTQCAEIAQILLHESIKKISRYWPGKIYLSLWLDKEHAFIKAMHDQYAIELTDQCAGDLGAKMQHAFESYGYSAAVMGADAPHIKPQELARAYDLLQQGKSAIGISEDGGYYLLGLSQPAPQLFTNMAWGTDQVLSETLNRAKQSKLELTHLDSLHDVDEWPDLLQAAKQIPQLAEYLEQARLW